MPHIKFNSHDNAVNTHIQRKKFFHLRVIIKVNIDRFFVSSLAKLFHEPRFAYLTRPTDNKRFFIGFLLPFI